MRYSTVLLRSGHVIKVGRDFDESAFARVVALLADRQVDGGGHVIADQSAHLT